jgi:hypothetical protein
MRAALEARRSGAGAHHGRRPPHPGWARRPGLTLLDGCCKRRCKSGVSSNRARTVSSTVPGVTEPDAPGPSPAADPHDALPYAGQVVRRVLLRRNIVIDAETAQLVAAAVQAALQTGTPSRWPGRGLRVPADGCEPLS